MAKVGKYAMATLLISGVLVLWLKWDWVIPNNWFWVKMGFIVVMIVFISINDMNAKKAKAGDMAAAARSKTFGQLTGVAFLGVIVSAVFASTEPPKACKGARIRSVWVLNWNSANEAQPRHCHRRKPNRRLVRAGCCWRLACCCFRRFCFSFLSAPDPGGPRQRGQVVRG